MSVLLETYNISIVEKTWYKDIESCAAKTGKDINGSLSKVMHLEPENTFLSMLIY